jgi:predicted ester cyclase
MTTVDENIEIVRQAFKHLESGDIEQVKALTGPEYRIFTEHCAQLTNTVLSNCRITLEDTVAQDDKVVTRYTVRGTHTGDGDLTGFGFVPATGRQVAAEGLVIHRLEDGKIVEGWGSMDLLETMMDLGVIKPRIRREGGVVGCGATDAAPAQV